MNEIIDSIELKLKSEIKPLLKLIDSISFENHKDVNIKKFIFNDFHVDKKNDLIVNILRKEKSQSLIDFFLSELQYPERIEKYKKRFQVLNCICDVVSGR